MNFYQQHENKLLFLPTQQKLNQLIRIRKEIFIHIEQLRFAILFYLNAAFFKKSALLIQV